MSETACTDVAVPVGVVVGVAVVVAALVAAVVFVVYKNRKITYKYTKLLQDQGADLEAMADDRRPAAVGVGGDAGTQEPGAGAHKHGTTDDREDEDHSTDATDTGMEGDGDTSSNDDSDGVGHIAR